MNCGPDSKQPKMCDIVIPKTRRPQSMVYSTNYDRLDSDGSHFQASQKAWSRFCASAIYSTCLIRWVVVVHMLEYALTARNPKLHEKPLSKKHTQSRLR
jgi:hypothetical protein